MFFVYFRRGLPLGATCICPVYLGVLFSVTNLYLAIFTYPRKKKRKMIQEKKREI